MKSPSITQAETSEIRLSHVKFHESNGGSGITEESSHLRCEDFGQPSGTHRAQALLIASFENSHVASLSPTDITDNAVSFISRGGDRFIAKKLG